MSNLPEKLCVLEEVQYQLKLNLGDSNQAFKFLGLRNENLK